MVTTRDMLTVPLLADRPLSAASLLHPNRIQLPAPTNPFDLSSFTESAMADVRAMLRAERAARAATSSRPQKQGKQSPATPFQPGGRKRKAGDESIREIIKRFRAEEKSKSPEHPEQDSAPPEAVVEKPSGEEPAQETPPSPDPGHVNAPAEEPTSSREQQLHVNIDKDEWAAFERDMAAFPPDPSGKSALDAIKSGGTISAAPMTADEVAAQAQDERTHRSRREEEMAEEKEDAAQALEDEFDEMEELEQRAKRLREMRERLREQQTVGNPEQQEQSEAQQDEEEDDDDDDVGDDFDDWIKLGRN